MGHQNWFVSFTFSSSQLNQSATFTSNFILVWEAKNELLKVVLVNPSLCSASYWWILHLISKAARLEYFNCFLQLVLQLVFKENKNYSFNKYSTSDKLILMETTPKLIIYCVLKIFMIFLLNFLQEKTPPYGQIFKWPNAIFIIQFLNSMG